MVGADQHPARNALPLPIYLMWSAACWLGGWVLGESNCHEIVMFVTKSRRYSSDSLKLCRPLLGDTHGCSQGRLGSSSRLGTGTHVTFSPGIR